jgi:hypothetical protein
MKDISKCVPANIACLCLFCGAELTAPEEAEFNSGDMIKCSKCGNMNDWDSVYEATKERALEVVGDAVQKNVAEAFKDIFKK